MVSAEETAELAEAEEGELTLAEPTADEAEAVEESKIIDEATTEGEEEQDA
jgi:hypothetical protein